MAATAQGIRAGKAFVEIGALDKTALVLSRVEKRLLAFSARVGEIGRSAISKALVALVPAGLGAKTFAGFDDAMRKVEARSSGTARQMALLREQAKRLGRETSFTAAQVAELQAKLAQKGFNRGQILKMTDAVLALARAAGEGTEEDTVLAADLLSGALRAFGADASQAARFADVFTAAVNNSNFSLQDLITSLSTAAPVAKAYGVGLEDTVAVLAGMTNLNIDASTAGTAFRNMLLKLSDAASREKFNQALQEATGTTIQFVDAAGNLKPLPDLLFSIGEAMKGLGTAEQGKLLADLFGLRAVVPAAALGQGKNAFQELVEILRQSQGVAQRTAQQMDAGLGGAFRKLTSAVEGFLIAIGDAISGPLSAFVDWLGQVIQPITQWVERNQALVFSFVAAAAGLLVFGGAMLGLKVALAGVAAVLGVVSGTLSLVGTLLGVILSPIGLIAAALGAAVAAAAYFSETFRSAMADAATSAMAGMASTVSTLQAAVGAIMKAIQAGRFDLAWQVVWLGVQLIWAKGINWVRTKWENFRDAILNVWTDAKFGLAILMVRMWGGLRKTWNEGIGRLKWGIVQGLAFIVGKASDAMANLVEIIGSALVKVGILSQESLDTAVENIRNNTVRKGLERKADQIWNDMEATTKKITRETEQTVNALGEDRNAELRRRAEKTRREQAKRQQHIQNLQTQLQETINQINQLQDESQQDFVKQLQEQQSRVENLIARSAPRPAAATPTRPTEVLRGLEKGTVAAMEQAIKNSQAGQLGKLLQVNQEQRDLLRDAVDGIQKLTPTEVV